MLCLGPQVAANDVENPKNDGPYDETDNQSE